MEKNIEAYLIEANRLKVVGPDKYDEKEYIRLKKPLIEYINDLKENKIKNEINAMSSYLNKDFKTNDNILINFTGNNDFTLQKDKASEKGYYKITYDSSGYLITFLFDDNNSGIFKFTNYLIKIYRDKDYFSLIPVKIKIDKVVIDDFKEIVFYRIGDSKG